MKHKNVWSKCIAGFPIEVQNWKTATTENEPAKDNWTYYVYLSPSNVSYDAWQELLAIPKGKYSIEYSDSWLAAIEWHCGITYASFEYGPTGDVTAVKAGCDYQHYWDEGHEYTLEDIERDASRTLTSILRHGKGKGEPAEIGKEKAE